MSTTSRASSWAVVAAVLVATWSADASAQRHSHPGDHNAIDGVRIDIHADFGWWHAFGAGLRIDIPIVPNGFLSSHSIHDELALSPGVDLWFVHYHRYYRGVAYYDEHYVSVWPILAMQWNLYLGRSWSIFPEVGVVFLIWDDYYHYHHRNYFDEGADIYILPHFGFGVRWHFTSRNALFIRLTWPGGGQFGITF